MVIDFTGKSVLITGAGGYVGHALCKSYCESGVENIILLDHPDNTDRVIELADECSKTGVGVKYYFASYEDISTIEAAVEKMNKDGVKVDILVNNAGLNVMDSVSDINEEIWDYVFDVNIKGAFFLTKLIAEQSLVARKGNIVFVASQHAVVGNVKRASYCASKSAILGLVNALTAEWAPYGIRVNCVSPTFIINATNYDYLMSPENKRKYLNKIPLKHYAKPEDIANAITFLSSQQADSITGHNLIVDGGYTRV